jgi:MFS superfamily sulfate permease-like transporter
MNQTIERIAGFLGMALITAFLVGLADSIHRWPFWVIVAIVLTMGWVAYYEEAVRRKPLGEHDT